MLLPAPGRGFGLGAHGIDDPHHNSADQQRPSDDHQCFEVLADDFGEQERRNGGDHEGNDGQAQGMGEDGAVSALAAREGGEEFCDSAPEVNRQAQDRAELDDDGIHLPIAVGEADVQQRFGEPQMRGRTYGQELSDAFDNS